MKNAGLFPDWDQYTMYTALSRYMMCAGTIIQYGIPRVVIGENQNFGGNEECLRKRGVDVTVMNVAEMMDYFASWMDANPNIWNEILGARTFCGASARGRALNYTTRNR